MNIGAPWPSLIEANARILAMQTKLHHWAVTRISGRSSWRARCGENRTPGSEGGPEKRTEGNFGTALRPDPYERHEALWNGCGSSEGTSGTGWMRRGSLSSGLGVAMRGDPVAEGGRDGRDSHR